MTKPWTCHSKAALSILLSNSPCTQPSAHSTVMVRSGNNPPKVARHNYLSDSRQLLRFAVSSVKEMLRFTATSNSSFYSIPVLWSSVQATDMTARIVYRQGVDSYPRGASPGNAQLVYRLRFDPFTSSLGAGSKLPKASRLPREGG